MNISRTIEQAQIAELERELKELKRKKMLDDIAIVVYAIWTIFF